jgi:uncharacterized protein (TIGR01777 family)
MSVARRVIITGGTGLLGSALSRELLGDGHEVIVLTRDPARRDVQSGVRLVGWDGKSPEGWGDLVNGAHALVNLAGASLGDKRWTAARKRVLSESRLQSGRAVAEAVEAASTPPQVVIQASAVGYYGHCGDEVLDESSPAGDDFAAQLCREWEASSLPVEAVGVRRVVVRTGLALSPAGGTLGKLLPVFRFGLGGRLGSGRQWMPWIHIDDVVAAYLRLITDARVQGPVNVASPHPVRNSEFTQALARAIHRPAPWIVPAFALRILVGELADALVTGQRVAPRALGEAGFEFRYPHLKGALEDLLG